MSCSGAFCHGRRGQNFFLAPPLGPSSVLVVCCGRWQRGHRISEGTTVSGFTVVVVGGGDPSAGGCRACWRVRSSFSVW